MNDLTKKLLVAWYRLLGNTDVQAEWKARQAMQQPEKAADVARTRASQALDRRFRCVCGNLLVDGDKTCDACGRRQYLPYPVRSALKFLGLAIPSATPGTVLMGFLIAVGYAIQIRYASGTLWSPSRGLELFELGASVSWLTVGPQPWRAFTYTMLHGGIMHIGFNVFALSQVGPLVEQRFGTARFVFSYALGGAAAVAVPPLIGFGLNVPTIGASGAVFSLIGMALIEGHRSGTTEGRFIRDAMIRWTIYATLFGMFMGGVAHAAHFGGLAAGILFGVVLPPVDRHPGRARLTLPIGLVAFLFIGATLAGWGAWYAAGRPVPPTLGVEYQMAWYDLIERERGTAEAYGEAAAALLAAAHERPGWGPGIEESGRLREVLSEMPWGQRAAFVWKLPAAWRQAATAVRADGPRSDR